MASFDLERAVRDASPGAVVSVPAGTYAVCLQIDKPLVLLGMGAVVLDGRKRGSVVRITTDGLVRLGGVMIVGGAADESGGGVCQEAGRLELMQCTLRYNAAPQHGGGAVYLGGREALLVQCRLEGNTGRQGGGLLCSNEVQAVVRDSTFVQNVALDGGGVAVREGASLELIGCTLADNAVKGDAAQGSQLSARGSTSRRPRVRASSCIVSERTQGPAAIVTHATVPAELSFDRCLLPPWCAGQFANATCAAPGYVGSGAEPYQLGKGSPALGAADPADFPAGSRDVLGHERGAKPDLGAFAGAHVAPAHVL